MGFDASEIRKLSGRLDGVSKQAGHLARTVVRKAAKDIEHTAKSLAPVDTGNLKGSIVTSDLRAVGTSGTITAEVQAKASYSGFVELGTSRMAPQPFMGPAADKHSPVFAAAMAEIMARAAG